MKNTSVRATGLAASLSLLALCSAGALQAEESAAPAAEVPVLLASEQADLPPLLIAQTTDTEDAEAKSAADAEPLVTPTADVVVPVEPLPPPAAPGWTWALTPRIWLLWEHDFYFQNDPGSLGFQQSNEATFIPFAGGSVSVTPGPGAPTFSVTALYGEGSGDVRGAGLGVVYDASVDVKRLDIEGIAQIPAAEGFSWILGGRFINFRRDEEGVFNFFFPAEFHLEQNFYLAEAGFSVVRPINAAGTFIGFGNLLGMLGYADVVEASQDFGVFNVPEDELQGGVFGVDTNAGLGWRLGANMLLSARYRLFFLTAPDFNFKDGGTFMHGPEVNLTFSFGG